MLLGVRESAVLMESRVAMEKGGVEREVGVGGFAYYGT